MNQSTPLEVAALEKHECPACGAQAEWNATTRSSRVLSAAPSRHAIDRETGKVVEVDLVATLRAFQTKRADGTRSAAASVPVVPRGDGVRGGAGRPELRVLRVAGAGRLHGDQGANQAAGHPAVPHRHGPRSRRDSRLVAQQMVRARTPGTKTALVDTVRSIYIPAGPSTRRSTALEAEAGYHYYVPVPTKKGVRMERRTRWEPASGVVDTFFDDEAVPGTQGLPVTLLRQIEPFPTGDAVACDTAFLSGHVVEHYKVVLLEAAQHGQDQMHARLEQLCAQQVPGDTYRNLRIHPDYSNRTFKHVLVPVWVLSMRLRQTGVSGDRERLHGHDCR